MNILLIGASGFVSGTTARLAVEGGHNVFGITRGQRPLHQGVKPLVGDREDAPAFDDVVASAGTTFDLIIDGIGYQPHHAQQDLTLLEKYGKHLVFISTDFVYEPSKRTFPQTLDNQHFSDAPYAKGKRECEQILAKSSLKWTIVRPCHIYGPGSQLGCLPLHSRDAQLIEKLQRGKPLTLVGAGRFLQQPIYAADLARVMLACPQQPASVGKTYLIAGPDIIESRRYYEIIAEHLGVEVKIHEAPIDAYLAEHPEHEPFLCHRIYDLSALKQDGLPMPSTPIKQGLATQTDSLL